MECEHPDDANFHWTRDREHVPEPITPLFLSVVALIANEGRRRVLPVYEEPIVDRYDRRINTYCYSYLVPFQGTPEEVAARAERNRAKVRAASLHLSDLWANEWLPEILTHWATWDAFDLPGASLPTLREHLEESLVRATRLQEIHFLLGPPMWFAIHEFAACYQELFPGSTVLDAHHLLQGFNNKTMEIGRALWQLSRVVLRSPTLTQMVRTEPLDLRLGELEASQEGREFLGALRAFLADYGGRSNLWDWGYPSWAEDPTPLFRQLQGYLAQPDRNLLAEHQALAAEREQAVAQAHAALDSASPEARARFEQWLRAAQAAIVLTEDHSFYIDFNGFGRLRRVFLEVGKRLTAEGRLHQDDDLFYLTLGEVRESMADSALNLASLAVQRRAEVEHWAKVEVPTALGKAPEQRPTFASPDASRQARYIAGPLPATTEEAEVRGIAASPGRVRGTARVIHSLAEASRLQKGDILVTTTTAPPWTPLFLTAAAVVTDAGGLLSHGAIVAREYRIPAVVGTRSATATIRDGQLIEVDGSAGIVRLL